MIGRLVVRAAGGFIGGVVTAFAVAGLAVLSDYAKRQQARDAAKRADWLGDPDTSP